jgi:hypothetical protein
MKTLNESIPVIVRHKYTAQFNEQILEHANKEGVNKVAKDLGIAESIIYKCGANLTCPSKIKSCKRRNWRDLNVKSPDLKRLCSWIQIHVNFC